MELLRSTMLMKIISLLIMINGVTGTITGLNYMEPIVQKNYSNYPPGEDPCNPLYWYPRQIPDYCNYKIPPQPKVKPFSVPIPVPMLPPPPPPPPPPPMFPIPVPVPLPYGLPLAPSGPIIPVPGAPGMPIPGMPNVNFYQPYQSYGPFGGMAGLMPGIEGLVTRDGGINVLPFSDAYSDLIEKHKNKMVRKKLNQLMENFDRKFNDY